MEAALQKCGAAFHEPTGYCPVQRGHPPQGGHRPSTPRELTKQREINLLGEVGARYHNVPFSPASTDYVKQETELFRDATDLGELYLYRIRRPECGKRLVDSLELIADRNNHPLVFHCSVGKDRTGVLAAMLLAAAGVIDEDIVHDYTLSAPFMPEIRDRWRNDPTAPPE